MWDRLLRRGSALDANERAALARVLESPVFEMLPLKSAADQVRFLPAGATVSVTASPTRGLDATLDLAVSLAAKGFAAVPHLAARQVRDEAHLRTILGRLAEAGIHRIFVVGGDANEPGAYQDGLAVLRAMADLGELGRFRDVGIACYPDGHAFIPEERLLDALRAKTEFATSMTTQLCFDAGVIGRWLAARRAEGLRLPAIVGVPGVTEPHRLLAISARIGVRDSGRFLVKNAGLIGRLVRSGGFYRPEGLLAGLAPVLADPALDVRGLHLYTFNQIAGTEAWRQRYLERLSPDEPAAA